MATHLAIWWNVQRLLKPGGGRLGRSLDATKAQGWTRDAYNAKIARLGAVLADVAGDATPVLIALAEVEDKAAARAVAAAAGWPGLRVVEDQEAQLEGDDLVILFDPNVLTLAEPPASYNIHNRYTTRDLYEATFATGAGHQFVLITNHWPSRLISNSEPFRIGLADYCRRLVERRLKYTKDELLTVTGRSKMPSREKLERKASTPVFVVGDVNDEPFDTSVRIVLGATRERRQAAVPLRLPRGRGPAAVDQYLALQIPLFNASWPLMLGTQPALGTTSWNGSWYLLDQVIVSRGALGQGPVSLVDDSVSVHLVSSVTIGGGAIQTATRGGIPLPFDAATGKGASDHLPVSFMLDFD